MAGRKRNFNSLEKNLLIEILKSFKNVIENKKTDNVSTATKKAAWVRIAEKFNSSPIISESASGEQLRRLWQNLKTRQRDALTRERQHRMATGGGAPCPDADIDPNIAEISPALFVEVGGSIDSDCNDLITPVRVDDIIQEETILPPQLINAVNQDQTTTIIDASHTNSDAAEPTAASIGTELVAQLPSPTLHNNTIQDSFMDLSNEKKLRVQILKNEYLNREKRANELHMLDIKHKKEKHNLEIEILKKKLQEATAKAELAHNIPTSIVEQ